MGVTEDGELNENIDSEDTPDDERDLEQGLENLDTNNFLENVINMRHEEPGQHQLEQVGWQIVVKKQGSVIEEEWKKVNKISHKKNFSCLTKSLELCFFNVIAESPPPEQVEHEEAGVESEADRGGVPDQNVADQMNLVVGVLGDVVSDATSQEWPLQRITGEVVILYILLVGDQHLELQLLELLPERQDCLLLRYQLVQHHLLLDGGLVLVILGVPVLLHVPHCVCLINISV